MTTPQSFHIIENGSEWGPFTADELADMFFSSPTIHVGQYDNLKHQDPKVRVWVSRMAKEDGMPFDNAVTIETYDGNRWNEAAVVGK